MAEDVILSVKNISKSFGDLQVLKEIGFDIHKGEKDCNPWWRTWWFECSLLSAVNGTSDNCI